VRKDDRYRAPKTVPGRASFCNLDTTNKRAAVMHNTSIYTESTAARKVSDCGVRQVQYRECRTRRARTRDRFADCMGYR
jgi:hypothetical protein